MYLTQTLHRALRHAPDDPVTIFGTRVRTVREQATRVARLGAALRCLGVSSGDRVAVLARNSDRYAELLLAIPWADAVVVPLNSRWSTAEITYALNDSDTKVLFVDDAFAAAVPALWAGRPALRATVHLGDGATPPGTIAYEDLVADNEPISDARRGGDDLAGVFYTGGTTGVPKGVMLTHANLLTAALGTQASTSVAAPGGRLLHAAPMFHLADLTGWAVQQIVGGTHVIIPAFDPAVALEVIEEQQITNLLLVPTMLQMLVDDPHVGVHDLTSVRSIAYGASAIADSVLQRAMKTFPAADFSQVYGMTETSTLTALLPEDHREGSRLRSAGRAAAHSEVRIVDDHDREVPPGTVGEIAVRGANVMAGYWSKPDQTASALREGWLHTGDCGYMDDAGYVYVVDRLKDMIISGGENVYSVEVENAVTRHPAVAACAVIGVPDDHWGERVHAVIVRQPGTTVSADEIRDHTKKHIAGYKAPRSVEFVDALPLSGAGKVLKTELRARYRRDP